MDDPIKAALETAQREASSFYHMTETAAIIAAFLRALPPDATIPGADWTCPAWKFERWIGRDLAAAVERAAKEGGDGCPPAEIADVIRAKAEEIKP